MTTESDIQAARQQIQQQQAQAAAQQAALRSRIQQLSSQRVLRSQTRTEAARAKPAFEETMRGRSAVAGYQSELGKTSAAYEQEIAEKSPEYAKPEYLEQAYQKAISQVKPEIERLTSRVETRQERLAELQNRLNMSRSDSEAQSIIDSMENTRQDLDTDLARLNSLKGSISGDKVSTIKEVLGGNAEAKASYEEARIGARIERQQAYKPEGIKPSEITTENVTQYILENPSLYSKSTVEAAKKGQYLPTSAESIATGRTEPIIQTTTITRTPAEIITGNKISKDKIPFSWFKIGDIAAKKITQKFPQIEAKLEPKLKKFFEETRGGEITYGVLETVKPTIETVPTAIFFEPVMKFGAASKKTAAQQEVVEEVKPTETKSGKTLQELFEEIYKKEGKKGIEKTISRLSESTKKEEDIIQKTTKIERLKDILKGLKEKGIVKSYVIDIKTGEVNLNPFGLAPKVKVPVIRVISKEKARENLGGITFLKPAELKGESLLVSTTQIGKQKTDTITVTTTKTVPITTTVITTKVVPILKTKMDTLSKLETKTTTSTVPKIDLKTTANTITTPKTTTLTVNMPRTKYISQLRLIKPEVQTRPRKIKFISPKGEISKLTISKIRRSIFEAYTRRKGKELKLGEFGTQLEAESKLK